MKPGQPVREEAADEVSAAVSVEAPAEEEAKVAANVAAEAAAGTDGRHFSAITGFRSSPRPSTRTTTTSPGLSQRGGFFEKPTPAGVPVEMMSPGSSVNTPDRCSINCGSLKIRFRVFECCRVSPPIEVLMS